MDRTTNQYTINPATGLIPADVAKKASELGLLPQLHEYSTMNAQRRREVYPQVLLLAKALGTSTDNVKASLQLDVIFDPDEVRQQRVAAAAKAPVALARGPIERDSSYFRNLYSAYSNPYRDAAMRSYEAHGAYFPGYSSYNLKKEREYIDRLQKENARLEKEIERLEKENARLIELLPGRGGSRKRKATRKKRH